MTKILVSALLLMFAGCATAPAGPQPVPPEYERVRDFVQRAATASGMDVSRIVPTDVEAGGTISYADRQLYVSRKNLVYRDSILEPLLAHELGHHVLGHRGFVSSQDEAAANTEAVRILTRLYDGDEGRAFGLVYNWLLKLHRENIHGRGHYDACTEIAMLADAFPIQKSAWAGKDCIGS
jgi:hypothetical protein